MSPRALRAVAPLLVTAPLLIGLASTGGLSYAASSVDHAAASVSGPVASKHPVAPLHLSAGSDQYEPGYGFGDPNHNHPGAPGLSRENVRGGLREHNSRDGLGAIVRTAFNVDEQAHLYISVIDTSDSA